MADLLARALLLEKQDMPSDIVPYQDAGTLSSVDTAAGPGPGDRSRPSQRAAGDLQTLCEVVVAHTRATILQDYITESLPEPSGARLLGCILQLTGAEDSARFWWQYAAGAGDSTSSYSLYLQHLSLGDTKAAAWWREQTPIDTSPAPEPVTHDGPEDTRAYDASTPTMLHVLTRLVKKCRRPRPQVVDAMMHYVPRAVARGYIDNDYCELPPLQPGFAEQIAVLLNTASILSSWSPSTQERPKRTPELPRRRQISQRNARNKREDDCTCR